MPKMLKHYLLFLFPFIVSSVVLFDRDSFYFAPNNDDMYVEIKPSGVFYLGYAYFSLFFAYAPGIRQKHPQKFCRLHCRISYCIGKFKKFVKINE